MDEAPGARPARDRAAPSARAGDENLPVPVGEWTALDSVKLAVGVGLLLAALGVGLGVLLVAGRIQRACTGAGLVGAAGDGGCYAYPHGLEGTAVVVISLMLAILIWLTGRVAKAAIRVGATR